MTATDDLTIKIFADGADLDGILEMYGDPRIQGFTTNPTLMRKAGDEGKLFGSVGSADIADAVTEAGVQVERTEVRLAETNLRQTGDYEVGFQLHPDVTATITLKVEPEA